MVIIEGPKGFVKGSEDTMWSKKVQKVVLMFIKIKNVQEGPKGLVKAQKGSTKRKKSMNVHDVPWRVKKVLKYIHYY